MSTKMSMKIMRLALTMISLAGMYQLLAPQASPISSPRIPVATSWSGTRELAAGSPEAALLAVQNDTISTVADTLLRLFKIGTINATLGNAADAVAALNTVNIRSPLLRPLALEQIGDVHLSQGDHVRAMDAYSSVLAVAGLPEKYRQHIFAKIRPLVADHRVPLPSNRNWVAEYRRWEQAQRRFDIDGLEAAFDSLTAAGFIARADSLFERHLPDISRLDACRLVERVFSVRPIDSQTSTRFLLNMAAQANDCRFRATAQRMFDAAQERSDFTTALPARDALLLSANIAFSGSRWREAGELYGRFHAAHGPDSDVLMNAARSYRNLGDHDEARKWYDLHLRHFPGNRQSNEILWLRAWDFEVSGEYVQAAAAYRRVMGTNSNRVEEAHLRHALCYYKMGQHDSVIVHLNTFQSRLPRSNRIMASMFWQGKAHAAAGRTQEAHRVWNRIVQLNPADYHAHRASALMGVEHQVTTSAAAQMTDAQAREWLNSVSPASTRKRLTAQDTTALRRGAALLTVARPEVADFFFDNYVRNFGGNLQLQVEISTGYALAGSPTLSFNVAQRLSWRIPINQRARIPLQALAVMYPSAYAPTITYYAERFDINPRFVSSMMMQESTFNPILVSHAGAVGLTQIMPATGRDIIARELNEPFTVDSLYSYRYNIRFGTYYLSKRLAQFGGNHVLALAAYNAGAHNVNQWLERRKYEDDDVFIEDIGFRETRTYVKIVMGTYWTYQALMGIPGYEYYTPTRTSMIGETHPGAIPQWINER
ncbi:MAG: transglycosylase SLT domain-containing protein [Chitinispirillales bacterium]|jgi:soluble lytic murein transglycosylase-like protein|nr:transglycosylase SLT domain-containing protein [Chitinispirillales bacterium]